MRHFSKRNLLAAILLSLLLGCVSRGQRTLPNEATPGERASLYEAVNHEWLATTPISPDQPGVTSFQQLADDVQLQLRAALEESIDPGKDSPTTVKAKRIYQSFLDVTKRDNAGLGPIKGDLKLIDSVKTHADVALHFTKLEKSGVAAPLILITGPNLHDSKANIIWAVQSGLGMPAREMYLAADPRSTQLRELYQSYLEKLFGLAGVAKPKRSAADVLALEIALAKIQWSPEQMHDVQKSFTLLSYNEFQSLLSKLPVSQMFRELGLAQSYSINANQLSYLASLNTFVASRGVDSWKNYLRARLLTAYAPFLTSEFHAADAQHQKELGLIQDDPPVWKRGIAFTESCSKMLVGKLYVERYFSEDKKVAVRQIVEDILASAKDVLSRSERLSEPTRARALSKLASMTFNIGYPDTWQDFSALEVSDDAVVNFKNAAAYGLQIDFEKLKKPADPNDWERSPHEVNAFYDQAKNKFVLLAAILKKPFYDESSGLAERYGSLGFVVGHEIGHAFDDSGSQFDEAGNLNNWWTDEDRARFDTVKAGYIRQANAFEALPGVTLNGELQIGEIMGDATGAKLAIHALDKALKGDSDVRRAAHRTFFRELAKVWREHFRPEFAKLLIATDPHPAGKFRTDGIVQNMPQFHEAFGTNPGDAMYRRPEDRQQIW